ncbi:5-(carboxyamino)imidazole ribonucleotide synthase [Leptolyngbya ohadii]|uniref:5-(carboxyamino)imidazole ribonucleotide synthase n=1 Tax=Leptolyngbya ohadii TaxID=1962290 RepID=UPI001CECB047|nr:5-(carboxyamino)imidazole ribonucleotide synthase [Leptolyngbya ohadii]
MNQPVYQSFNQLTNQPTHHRIGVIGGGQLAWMMGDAAKKLQIALAIQTPSAADPAVSIATHTVFAPIADAAATAKLAELSDAITFENEFVDLEALRSLDQVQFYPSLNSLAPLLDKYEQRCFLRDRGLPTPEFTAFNPANLPDRYPVVLKSRRLGYDGQGTFICRDRSALEAVLQKYPVADPLNHWLLEAFVPFDRELAVMVARSQTGETVVYPVVETQQENQVCQRVIVTPEVLIKPDAPSVVKQVESIARSLLEALNYVGIMGIEFFLTQDGKVLVNETAPRTHNSGHYSLDACLTSQFEQQLRAVSGLPLGSPDLTAQGAVMVNLLGYEVAESDYAEKRQQIAQIPHSHLYWYGKSQSRPGRKLGHVTVLLEEGDRDQALQVAQQVESIWYPA